MTLIRGFALIWQIPLGIASFLYFRLLRAVFVSFGRRHFRKHPEAFRVWKPLQGKVLDEPQMLGRYMVTGPRWNTHALIATGGPVTVREHLHMNTDTLTQSAKYWAVCLYEFPSFNLAGATNKLLELKPETSVGGMPGQIEFHVPPGDYYVGVRLYDPKPTVSYPELVVDGETTLLSSAITHDANSFYPDLHLRDRPSFRFMHYYVYVAVKWRRFLPRAWVDDELLPVGDAHTTFFYGTLEAGEHLNFELDPALLDSHGVFCTTYTRSSLPRDSFSVSSANFTGPESSEPVVYLIRVLKLREADALENPDLIESAKPTVVAHPSTGPAVA
ncbi:DUF6208 family protein [Planktotalea sp.]|uniref:DUF6208 family protein n=1 Tax=Planktotalea sp. TaxID=2029877 RepID=UPI003296A20E